MKTRDEKWFDGDYVLYNDMEYNPYRAEKFQRVVQRAIDMGMTPVYTYVYGDCNLLKDTFDIEQGVFGEYVIFHKGGKGPNVKSYLLLLPFLEAVFGDKAGEELGNAFSQDVDLLDYVDSYMNQVVEVMKGFRKVEMPIWQAVARGFNI